MFLNKKQLKKMTGYKQHAAQIRWLAAKGFKFEVRTDGRPNVLIQQVRERQCKNVESKPEIDLSWMDEAV